MNDGQIEARHYLTRQPVRLHWRAGSITRIEPASEAVEWWIAPALVDLQINGFAGVDFQRDGLSLEALVTTARALRAAGCGRWLLTLMTDDWAVLMERLRHLRALRAQSPALRTAIAGWHIEGPFLSAEPGFHGTHNPALMCNPTASHIRELRIATESDPVLLTLAPERPGALEAIALASSLGIQVSLGHTDATVERLRQAVQAGATGFTHLSNGCPSKLDRHDNIVWRVLEIPELTVSLIADGIHVSPPLFRLVHRALSPASIYYTTDAMAAAGAPPGRYTLGPLELEVGVDQIVQQLGRTNYAGSACRPVDGVFRAARMLNCPWQEVWDRASRRPAVFMGWQHELAPGGEANFCLLKTTPENQMSQLRTYVRGQP